MAAARRFCRVLENAPAAKCRRETRFSRGTRVGRSAMLAARSLKPYRLRTDYCTGITRSPDYQRTNYHVCTMIDDGRVRLSLSAGSTSGDLPDLHGFHNPSTVSLLLDTVVGWRSGARRLARPSAESASASVPHDTRQAQTPVSAIGGLLRLAAPRARWQQRRREGAGREGCAINLLSRC